jgi:flagellar FliJ protein
MDPRVLRLLIDAARERRDDAAQRAAGARRERDAAATTLRTLTDYREESLARAPARAGHPVGIAQLHTARHFDARLVAAIGQQHQTHAERSREADAQDAALVERQQRLKALQTLQERRARDAGMQAAKREQRALDEFATNLSARRKAGRTR